MSKEITMKVGVKLSDAEIKAVDAKDICHPQSQPGGAAVEGQEESQTVYVTCPYCGCVGSYRVGGYQFSYFQCHCCAQMYRA
jgi:RNase P subunit RPR2